MTKLAPIVINLVLALGAAGCAASTETDEARTEDALATAPGSSSIAFSGTYAVPNVRLVFNLRYEASVKSAFCRVYPPVPYQYGPARPRETELHEAPTVNDGHYELRLRKKLDDGCASRLVGFDIAIASTDSTVTLREEASIWFLDPARAVVPPPSFGGQQDLECKVREVQYSDAYPGAPSRSYRTFNCKLAAEAAFDDPTIKYFELDLSRTTLVLNLEEAP